MELNGRSYARDARYKLTRRGDMFDLKNAPFEEIPTDPEKEDDAAKKSRKQLEVVLNERPAAPANKDAETRAKKKQKRQKRRAEAAA